MASLITLKVVFSRGEAHIMWQVEVLFIFEQYRHVNIYWVQPLSHQKRERDRISLEHVLR